MIIDSMDGSRTWSTMGSDTNIIAASAAALADSLEYRDLEVGRRAAPARRAPVHDGPSDRGRDAPPAHGATATPTEVTEMTATPQAAEATLQLARWTVTSGSNVRSRGAVVITSGDHEWRASAAGNGAIDALYRAIDKALQGVLGGHPRLLAFDIHALGEGPTRSAS